jgi:putative ABC transport system permease protein
MSLSFKLALRNLLHDRLRLIATIVGVVFSIVLVTVQVGVFLSFEDMATTMIDHASADLWVVPIGTKNFEDTSLLDDRNKFRALSISGVAGAVPLVIGSAPWRLPNGGTTPIFVIGSDLKEPAGLHPWHIMEGSPEMLSVSNAVAVDQSYFERLGISRLGDGAEIGDQRVKVMLITKGVRSFMMPYVFTSLERARAYIGIASNKATYFILRLAPEADVKTVRSGLRAVFSDAEVWTPEEFRARSRSFWLFETGAGAALFIGVLLGVIVGTVIVAQTLYSSTKEHFIEFATLRAIGSSSRYIYRVIIFQALINAVIGFSLATCVSWIIVKATADTALPVVMTPVMSFALFLLTVVMCVVSAISSIVRVMRIDPVVAFAR